MGSNSEKELILTINPGATSTKFAVFNGEQPMFKTTVEHSVEDLKQFERVFDQYQYRLALVTEALHKAGIDQGDLKAIVGRGGLLKPVDGGVYLVGEQMLTDMKKAERGEHASNLGCVMAYNMASQLGIPAFIVDPVSVDEMEAVATISGHPEMARASFAHTLNMKAVARKVAKEIGKGYDEVNFIVAHLGTGVSVAPHKKGRMVDVSNGKDEGAFAPDRCGTLPVGQLVKLCYSGKYTYQQMQQMMFGKGGIYAYLGTTDIREVEAMAAQGNDQASLIIDALSYQVAKEIGAMGAVLAGEVDRIILTGGIAHSKRITEEISRRVGFIAPVVLVPGEEELESLALGALRVLRGMEQAKQYC